MCRDSANPNTGQFKIACLPMWLLSGNCFQASNEQIFYYRRVLWQYLCDNHGCHGCYFNFCHYLNRIPEFKNYFRKRTISKPDTYIRYETPAGKQAQLDWKESLKLLTTDLGWVEVNIFVLLLSFSRYRVYRMVI